MRDDDSHATGLTGSEADPPHAEPGSGQDWLGEVALVGRAQEGDVTAFETLVRRYQGQVLGLARRMLDDRGEAEDVVQDTFTMVWRRLPTLVDPTVFRAWMFQIATRRCLNVVRTRARRPGTPSDAADLEAAANTSHPGQLARSEGAGDPAAARNARRSSPVSTRCSRRCPMSNGCAGYYGR